MRKLLNWLFGWPLISEPHPCYVIVYDRTPPGALSHEAYEEYYGYFSTPYEARRVWSSYEAGNTNKFTNVKLCKAVQSWR